MNTIHKEHSIFFIALISAMFIFMGKMIFLKEAFITGDNLVQGLPWLKVFADSIKNYHFPFWVNNIHCGFPLIAEGQVGGFYPFNLLFFFMLPFKFAYNFSVIFHLFIAGTSTYFLARRLGADLIGGILSAIILCFGSAFSNIGYHLAMIRSLSFFPLGILLIEFYFNNEENKYIFLLSLVMSLQILSGSVQTAVYSFLLYSVYLLYGISIHKLDLRAGFIKFFVCSIIPIICFIPQLLLTLKVVEHSGRISSLDFALWGSLNPVSILTCYFPTVFRFKGQITTEDFFLGSLTVLFIISAIRTIKKDKSLLPILFTGLIAVFLALGWFNPIYIIALKLAKFYTFRAPARFVFFFIFSCSILAGIGFTNFFHQTLSARREYIRTFLKSIYLVSGLVITGALILIFAKEFILYVGHIFVEKFIDGTAYHRYNIYDYYHKVDAVYTTFVKSVLFSGKRILISTFFVSASVLFSYIIMAGKISMRIRKNRVIIMTVALGLITLNLWVYRSFPGAYNENVNNFSEVFFVDSTVYEEVKAKGEDYRILPFGIKSGKLPVWAIPNMNMFFDINSVAAYSPLSSGKYYNLLKDFQVVDDSLGLKNPIKRFDANNMALLDMLNVKYIVSPEKLIMNNYFEAASDKGLFLYENKNPVKKGFFVNDLNSNMINDENVTLLESKEGYAKFQVKATAEGFFVFSQYFFPGWKVYVNDQEKGIVIFNDILMAVKIKPGDDRIVFKYNVY